MNNDFIKNKKLFLLDQDGTIYNGKTLFKETVTFLNHIKQIGATYAFVTNNTSKSISDYIAKLASFGIESSEKDFFSATNATIIYLQKNHNGKSVYPVGTKSFVNSLKAAGIKISTHKKADIALLAYDSELNYKKLSNICQMLLTRDVVYLATNVDLVCPVEFGAVPDCGSFAQIIENATKKVPYFIGKPNKDFLDLALVKYGFSKEETVMIGDRLYTDILSGINSNIDTVLVLTGEATLEDVENSNAKPTLIANTLLDIIN